MPELDQERFVGGAGDDKLQKDLEEATTAARKRGATDSDRAKYRKLSKQVAEQRTADREKMESEGLRFGPKTPENLVVEAAEGVAAAETAEGQGGVSSP